MKKLTGILMMLMFTIGIAAAQGNDTLTVKSTTVCGMCKTTIEKAMAYEKGVVSTNVDYREQTIMVIYNTKKTDAEKIKKAITETGYAADEMPANEKAYNRLKACCQIHQSDIHDD
ncbi:MAG: heavy-metal-associated domain-containing protein [Bacteroidia bacterium]